MFFSFQPLNWPQKLSPSFSLILCEVTRTEWWPGQKSMITLEVLADRRVGGQKSKPRSRGTDNWGQSPCKHLVTGRRQGWERAGVGWALGCPAGEVLVWGQLLAQPSCTFSPSLLMRMSPRLSSAWDPVVAANWKPLAERNWWAERMRTLQRQSSDTTLEKTERNTSCPSHTRF